MTRICARHGVIEAEFCPTCGERTIPRIGWAKVDRFVGRLGLAALIVTALAVGGFLLLQLAISQHRKAEAAAESRIRLIESLPDGWRFCYSALSRLNDYSLKVAALKSYSEDPKLKLTPLNHEQIDLFMSLFGDYCWESNKTAAFAVLSRYVNTVSASPRTVSLSCNESEAAHFMPEPISSRILISQGA